MARVSFTLRRETTAPDLGSYLRYSDTDSYESYGSGGASVAVDPRTDVDSALRSDGLQTAPLTFEESFLDASSVCYGEVDLTWQVNIEAAGATPVITGVVLVYSPTGEPQTIASGDILVESSNTYAYTHTGLTEGRWAYYSLFVHYESTGGDSYYERAASLSVLVTKNYGSTDMLWKRIPEYYRTQDVLLGDTDWSSCIGLSDTSTVVGPLYKYLSIVGFDIDNLRTLCDYQMVAIDPYLSHTENLDALAYQLASPLRESDLGTQRLRNLLNDIGFFRRSKGTIDGTKFFVKAISGSDIELDTSTGEVTVYSQRVNYVTVPKSGSGIVTHRAAFNVESTEAGASSFSLDTSAYSGTYSVSGAEFTTTGSGASVGVEGVILHLSSPIPVKLNDRAVFSVNSNIGTSAIKWVRLVDGSENVIGFEDTSSGTVSGARVFEVLAASNASATAYTAAYIEYFVDLSEVAIYDNSYLLAERNFLGDYFDGDTVRGGWLIDSSSVSDYRWEGSANNSVSLFAEDYERTKAVVNDLLYDVIPVTEESKYTIVAFNAVPGSEVLP